MKTVKKYRNILLRVMDIIIIAVAYYIAEMLIDNSFKITNEVNQTIINTVILAIIIYSGLLHIFKTYKNITRYENGNDYLVYVLACLIAYIVITVIKIVCNINMVNPRTNMIAALIIVTTIIGYRVLLRLILTENYKSTKADKNEGKNVLIIGAGDATRVVLRTLRTNMKNMYNVIGLIDDNTNKVNYAISGKKILGTRYDIQRICKENKVEAILFTISNISNQDRKDILEICQETGCKVRILPGTEDLIKNKNLMDSFRDVEIEDLLGREPIKLDNRNIEKLIENKVVLVTGGGGSIGSELCRQIVKYNPERLIIVDIYENNLYDIEQELRFNYPKINVDAIVASVRDKKRLNEIFEEFKPYLVFHAAAHKHVPLMETSPLEAIKNNVFGTYNVVNCADEYDVKRFILISTDKAVNPTNIMGATKRLCEMIVQAKNKVSKTEYAAVRFGNVLGSNGSVVPLFKKQIAKGGPVTVTHKDITRFFMTIPEAVSLVLQAMSYAKGGEIFVLDMGEPVKIYDMAVNLIKLSGLEPNVDIQIKVTGLRPGEKLYEELLMAEEGLTQTKHDKIHIAKPMDINMNMIQDKLDKLNLLLDNTNNEQKEKIKSTFKEIVPTYKEDK
ncbi:MAG: polysaccharide biosynthesis protein [Clostridia bacterium]|nr:polysaccharide biosynthesis protein [Clostridia bacterium]